MPPAAIDTPEVSPALPIGGSKSAPNDFDTAFPDDGIDSPEPSKPAADAPPSPETDDKAPETPEVPSTAPKASPAAKEPPPSTDTDSDQEMEPPKVAKPAELRAFAVRAAQRVKKAQSKISELSAKIAELEKRPADKQADNAVVQELATAKKRLEEYEKEIQLTKYERSQDYQTNYAKPYQDAVRRAYRDVKELIAYDPNPDDPDSPIERQATERDFDEIYSLPTGQAFKAAKQRFGDAAMAVIAHRTKIRELAESAYQAVEEHKGKAGEIETRTKAEQEARERAMVDLFAKAKEQHGKRNVELFNPRDGDDEGNELLSKGQQFAAAVFGGNDGLSPVQIAQRDAVAFNRLSAYPRLIRDYKKARTELAEAQKTIAELRGSGPGPAKPAASKPSGDTYKSAMDAFDEAVPE